MYRIPNDEEITAESLGAFLEDHRQVIDHRYRRLIDAYLTRYPIFDAPICTKKPDKRIAVNFAKYIVDTMNGFFMGAPVKTMSDDEKVADYLNFLNAYNNQDDQNSELSKLCDIYGRGYEMYYVDEVGNIGITHLSPMESFMIYDDSILARPRYFVRYYVDADNVLRGSISDSQRVRWFYLVAGVRWDGEDKIHGFDGVPAVEYMDNEEKIGLFEPVMSMINEYNETISEKANDIEYFADAYLKILGAVVDEDDLGKIKENRIINFPGTLESGQLVVDFLKRPDGDGTQEHMLDRLERLIFQIAMVGNISDEDFGNASGIALKYKIWAMSNLAKTKEKKFIAGMQKRYKLIFSNPVSGMNKDAWTGITYQFTQNMPSNLLEEAQTAAQLTGIVSQPTQLKILSIVDDVNKEIEQMKEERDDYSTEFPTNRTVEVEDVVLE